MQAEVDAYVKTLSARHPPFMRSLNYALGRLNKPDSPLESVFLILWVFHHSYRFRDTGAVTYSGGAGLWCAEPNEGSAIIDLQSQVKIGRYRLDFLVTVDHPGGQQVRFAVECDGHNFHDRTAKQASSDRARDRRLLREGIVTMRFTYDDLMSRSSASIKDLWDTVIAFTRAVQP